MERKKIVLDICGADAAPSILARGAALSLCGQDEFDIIAAGPADVIAEELARAESESGKRITERCEVIDCREFITNYDDPRDVIRGKNETSMVRALKTLKERGDACAMVSAGSTGCLMIGSVFRLGILKGLLQPALASPLLSVKGGYICLLDCGANMNCKAKDFLDYARLGSAMAAALNGTERPPVGLINVGAEKGKGTEMTKEAYALLEGCGDIDFVGNIEGSGCLSGKAEVLVTDGFTGNVLLKALEAAGLIAAKMARDPEDIVKFYSYNDQGGAVFLGTKKIIVKAHGAANENTVKACLNEAWLLEKGRFTEKLQSLQL